MAEGISLKWFGIGVIIWCCLMFLLNNAWTVYNTNNVNGEMRMDHENRMLEQIIDGYDCYRVECIQLHEGVCFECDRIKQNESQIGYSSFHNETNTSLRLASSQNISHDLLLVSATEEIWRISANGSFYWRGEYIKESPIIAERLESFFYNTTEFCGCEREDDIILLNNTELSATRGHTLYALDNEAQSDVVYLNT